MYFLCHNMEMEICVELCDAIFPPKTLEIIEKNHTRLFEIKISITVQSLSSI